MIPATDDQKAELGDLIDETDRLERQVSGARYRDEIGNGIRDLFDRRLDRIRDIAGGLIMDGAYRSREP